jgi:hypothetical protein
MSCNGITITTTRRTTTTTTIQKKKCVWYTIGSKGKKEGTSILYTQ